MKPITVEDYREVADEFWDKYDYVAQHIGESAKTEDILKVMETLAGLVMKKRAEDKVSPMGFNKHVEDDDS